ncbi:MAG TPA: hypothetical protein VN968_27735, partial [Bradyrhizobium sp.]|nr:hypothetical protein [Bradyrhizobium sp.]
MEAIVNPPSRGSRLDADHPKTGALFHADLQKMSSTIVEADPTTRRVEASEQSFQTGFTDDIV